MGKVGEEKSVLQMLSQLYREEHNSSCFWKDVLKWNQKRWGIYTSGEEVKMIWGKSHKPGAVPVLAPAPVEEGKSSYLKRVRGGGRRLKITECLFWPRRGGRYEALHCARRRGGSWGATDSRQGLTSTAPLQGPVVKKRAMRKYNSTRERRREMNLELGYVGGGGRAGRGGGSP